MVYCLSKTPSWLKLSICFPVSSLQWAILQLAFSVNCFASGEFAFTEKNLYMQLNYVRVLCFCLCCVSAYKYFYSGSDGNLPTSLYCEFCWLTSSWPSGWTGCLWQWDHNSSHAVFHQWGVEFLCDITEVSNFIKNQYRNIENYFNTSLFLKSILQRDIYHSWKVRKCLSVTYHEHSKVLMQCMEPLYDGN